MNIQTVPYIFEEECDPMLCYMYVLYLYYMPNFQKYF